MKTIIEVGAHTGIETMKFLQDIEAQVYAFEPNKEEFRELQRLSRQYPRLTVLPFAVDNGDGQEPLFHAEEGNSSLQTSHNFQVGRSVYKYAMVWTIRLDTFFEMYSIHEVDYLRIDAPWSELMCVESIGNRSGVVNRGRIRSYDEENKGELLAWLYDHGFSVQLDTVSHDVTHPDIRFWRN